VPLIQIAGARRDLHAVLIDRNGKILMEFDYAISLGEREPRVVFWEGQAFLRQGADHVFRHVPSLRLERNAAITH
jgi:hypothetical protein